MRKLVFLFIMSLLTGAAGCDKEDEVPTGNPGVDTYIQQLKSGEYDSNRLPEFDPEDIPSLLHYRNEKMMIVGFPGNPISSSFAMQECRLGIYVLWTIESVRAKSIGSNYFIGFPSQNPVLAVRNDEKLELVHDDKSHAAAAKAYYDWWYGNSGKPFDTFSHINPLEATSYRWH